MLLNFIAVLGGSLLRANFNGGDWLPVASTAANSTFMKSVSTESSSNLSGVGLHGVWVPAESTNRFTK